MVAGVSFLRMPCFWMEFLLPPPAVRSRVHCPRGSRFGAEACSGFCGSLRQLCHSLSTACYGSPTPSPVVNAQYYCCTVFCGKYLPSPPPPPSRAPPSPKLLSRPPLPSSPSLLHPFPPPSFLRRRDNKKNDGTHPAENKSADQN